MAATCGKCVVREYKMGMFSYYADGADLSGIIPDSNHIIIEKIGYDENKRPLYTMKVTDGKRPITELGYIVPPDTVPAYGLEQCDEPECTKMVSTTDEDGVVTQCNCGSDFCW